MEEKVPYNDGSVATVYEHLRASVDFLYNFRGIHNLIQIWGGDWNDCMNLAGQNHRGVSVWLSIAWYRACRQFIELARFSGRETNEESKISCIIMKRNSEQVINSSKTKKNSFTSLQLKLLEQINSKTICLSHKPNQQFKEDKEFYDLSDVSDFDLDE